MSRETVGLVLVLVVSYVGNPLSMLLAIKRNPAGWWIVAITQAAFVAFAVVAVDWRFGGQVLCLGIACYGVYKWWYRRDHEPAIGKARQTSGGLVLGPHGPFYIGEPRHGDEVATSAKPYDLADMDRRLIAELDRLANEYGRLGVTRVAVQLLERAASDRRR